jgi:hypothetical protein
VLLTAEKRYATTKTAPRRFVTLPDVGHCGFI